MAELVPIGAKLSGLVRFRCALSVMAGLVPAIHVERRWPVLRVGRHSTAWMPGTRPGMTESAALNLAPMGLVPAIHAAPLGRISKDDDARSEPAQDVVIVDTSAFVARPRGWPGRARRSRRGELARLLDAPPLNYLRSPLTPPRRPSGHTSCKNSRPSRPSPSGRGSARSVGRTWRPVARLGRRRPWFRSRRSARSRRR